MLKVKNFTRTFLSAAITPAQTIISVVPGTGATFPTLASGDYTYATLVHPQTNVHEVVRIVDITGDSLTVVRAQDDSAPASFPAASELAIQWNKQQVLDWTQQANAYTAVAPIVITGQQVSFEIKPGLTPGTYGNSLFTVDQYGIITAIAPGGVTGYATETTPGLVTKANDAEVVAGLDDLKYVSPLDIATKIAAAGINGTIDVPGGSMTLGNGAIVKWGAISLANPSGVSGGSDSDIVIYPVAFPTGVLSTWVCPRTATNFTGFRATLGTASQFTVTGDFGAGGFTTLAWIALGN